MFLWVANVSWDDRESRLYIFAVFTISQGRIGVQRSIERQRNVVAVDDRVLHQGCIEVSFVHVEYIQSLESVVWIISASVSKSRVDLVID